MTVTGYVLFRCLLFLFLFLFLTEFLHQNPQMDLQAQDRVHRIGQTRPVIVYRLCTAKSLESVMLEKTMAKRKLEKIVIHKKNFKKIDAETANLQLAELAEILRSEGNFSFYFQNFCSAPVNIASSFFLFSSFDPALEMVRRLTLLTRTM